MGSFNKKTRNPGFKPGGHWVECQRTGRTVRVQDIRKEWTGVLVAKEEWEPRHPQELIRGIVDNASAQGYVSTETTGVDVPVLTGQAVVGQAVAGDAVSGVGPEALPSGSFNTNTL